MVTIAIAGASSGLGLTFVQTTARNQAAMKKHKFVLLSRSSQPQWEAKGFESRQVDYTSHSQLVEALRGVHTVLCFIGNHGGVDIPISLINAAKQVGVKRFAPSQYAGNSDTKISAYKPKEAIWDAAKAAGFEVIDFQCGIFMSILATGTPKSLTKEGQEDGYKTGEEEALAGLRPWNYVINMKGGTADLVRDGSAKMVVTDTRDVAKFVLASLDLEHWPEKLGMQGDVTSFKDVIAYVEKVQKRKFLIKKSSPEQVNAQSAANPEKLFYNESRVAIDGGWAYVEPDLNKLFPEIKPQTMKEFVDKWWSNVELGEASWTEDVVFNASKPEES